MCSKVTCSNCGQPTWAGCGQHIEQALADVPVAERCTCDRSAPATVASARKGFLARLRGR